MHKSDHASEDDAKTIVPVGTQHICTACLGEMAPTMVTGLARDRHALQSPAFLAIDDPGIGVG